MVARYIIPYNHHQHGHVSLSFYRRMSRGQSRKPEMSGVESSERKQNEKENVNHHAQSEVGNTFRIFGIITNK